MLLSTASLIARMTPTALAEMIASLEQSGNIDSVEQATIDAMRDELASNVGDDEAAELIAAAK
jgi:hypothetical protein